MAGAWLGIIKQWWVLWENLGPGDRSYCLFLPSVLCYFIHPDYFVSFSVGMLSSAQAPSGLLLCVHLNSMIPFSREITSLFLLSSPQFQTTKNRTSSSGEKRLDLDLGFWVEMNQGNLWVSCLPLPPVLFSKISKQIGSSGKLPRFESSHVQHRLFHFK